MIGRHGARDGIDISNPRQDPSKLYPISTADRDPPPSPVMEDDSDPNIMFIRGTQIDTVARCTSTLKLDNAHSLQDSLREVEGLSSSPNASIDTTPIAGRNPDWNQASFTDSLFLHDLKRSLREEERLPPQLLPSQPEEQGRLVPPPSTAVSRAMRYFATFSRASNHRRFFVNVNGDEGIGPKTMRQGDVVVELSYPPASSRYAASPDSWSCVLEW